MNSVSVLLREVRRVMTSQVDGMSPGVVAVSGGADSVALLRALQTDYPATLTVAHLNHQLRGEESAADEVFVRELASQLGLPCRVRSVAVATLARGANLEATARRLRYEFFTTVAGEVGAQWIATGHTADDQAETVLHRLLRGTGLQGLRGIARLHNPVVRPLLSVTRGDVLDYLATLNQPFREDSSNADLRFTRNRLRRELLPLLKTFNPAIVQALGQLASQAGDAFEMQQADTVRFASEVELPRAGPRLIFDASKLAAVHPYRVRELFRSIWQREGWPASEMTYAHWSRLVEVALGNLPAADFPASIRARRVGAVVQIGR
jgi:tRNA(Ile)-lysidine synthase